MALRLAKDLKVGGSAKAGFDIKFTEGLTYDLDKLVSSKNRIDANQGLVIDVKNSKEIATKVMDSIKDEITTAVECTLYTDEVNRRIREIIKEVFLKYNANTDNITREVAREINFRANSYLRSLYKKHNLNFNVYYAGMSDSVKITYDFVSNDELNEYFSKQYEKLAIEYSEISRIKEGGLAISSCPGRIRADSNDYSKYLLDRCGESYNRKPNEYGLSESKVKIYWEEGTDDITPANDVYWENGTVDTTTSDTVSTVYDEIDSLKDKVRELEELVSGK